MKINTLIQSNTGNEQAVTIKEGIEVIPGIWIGGKTYWLTSGVESLIPDQGVSVHLKQEEESSEIQLFNISITNHRERQLHVKLLIQNRHYQSRDSLNRFSEDHDLFSFISPSEKVVFHLDHLHVYLANGFSHGKSHGSSTIQSIQDVFTDNIWACTQTGKLKYNPMASGDAVSLFLYDLYFKGKQTLGGKSWVISGGNETELIKLNESLLKTH